MASVTPAAKADRKLLLTKRELRKLENKIKENGYTIVPLRIYFNEKGYAKLEIGLGKGHDPRTFALVAFGGGGSLIASAIASRLALGKVATRRRRER